MDYNAAYASPVGQLWLTSDGEALTGLRMENPPVCTVSQDALPVFGDSFRWLDAYFRGEQPPVDVLPLSPSGTEFQKLVWDILLAIPFGCTRSYGDIAKEAAARMGRDKMSAQAIGGAVSRNPISIIIPCHRVIGAGGQLTGYAGGPDKKWWLLRHEEEHK